MGLAGLIAALALAGCGDDSGSDGPDAGLPLPPTAGVSGGDLAPPLAGMGGTGLDPVGTPGGLDASVPPGTGMDAGAGDAGGGDLGTDSGRMLAADSGSPSCPWEGPPPIPVDMFEPCDLCGGAVCVTLSLLTEEQADLLADCEPGVSKCVPNLFVETVGMFILEECRSIAGAEGRCVSECVPQVADQADRLPRDTCGEFELCAPCYDPITGEETGSCSQGCDPGPQEPPLVFEECCGGVSLCVPSDLVPEDQRDLLPVDTCTGAGELCAPRDLAADPNAAPDTCESIGGGEGRCLPACLPDVARQADSLPKDVCADGELCAPCYDPITGEDTGACSIGDDPGPTDPPFVFDGCCDDGMGTSLGSCVPVSLVPDDQQSLLGVDTCGGADELCAPKELAAGTYVPEDCDSWGDGEGRCLAECLPDVADRADQLDADVCGQGELCVPCTDPLSGEDTGACTLEGDSPAEPAYTFPGCCDDGGGTSLGTCVPDALVPADQLSLLGADTCSDEGFLCAPTELATGTYQPAACDSWLGAEGRCLPACLPDVAAQADRLKQDVCAMGLLCVPCFDPLGGEDTGACTLEGDMPQDPSPVTFPSCCPTDGSQRGTCVPAQAAGDQAASLPVLDCETQTGDADSYVCAPNEKIADPLEPFVGCTTVANCGANIFCLLGGLGGQGGACVPACLLSEQADTIAGNPFDIYAQSTCQTGEKCAPCEDPLSGDPTGLCDAPYIPPP